jgi:hypothetical protein
VSLGPPEAPGGFPGALLEKSLGKLLGTLWGLLWRVLPAELPGGLVLERSPELRWGPNLSSGLKPYFIRFWSPAVSIRLLGPFRIWAHSSERRNWPKWLN